MDYALLAGEHAQAVYANQQALDHYRQADAWLAQGWVILPPEEITQRRADLAEKEGQVHSLIGEYDSAETAFTRARQMWADLENWRGVVRVLNQLSFLRFVQDDHVGVSHYAELALAALPETKRASDLRAASLTYLGLSARIQGRYDEALPSLEEALALFEEGGEDLYGLARCLNSLGLVHLERGDLAQADPCFAPLRQQIGDRQGEAWCWLNQGHIALAQSCLVVAREKLVTARTILTEIQHPYGLEYCAQMLGELEQAEDAARQAYQASVRLPRADAPTGRPLRDDEWTNVTWTITVLEDESIKGKKAQRQHRLLRLLREATEQGAIPGVDDLANALDVNPRTVKRDLAALRAEGHEAATRGSRAK